MVFGWTVVVPGSPVSLVPQYTLYPVTPEPLSVAPVHSKYGMLLLFCHVSLVIVPAVEVALLVHAVQVDGLTGEVSSYLKVNMVVGSLQCPTLS